MNEKERLDKIAELKEQMRSILETAKTEKRNLSEDEKEQFDKLREEKDMHIRYFEANEVTPSKPKEEFDIRKHFAEEATKAVKSGNKMQLEVRATPPIDSADVVDTIPVLYKDILEALEPALILDRVGLKMQTNVQGEPMWPTIAGVEATIEGENVEVADSAIDFGKLKASPKRLALSIPVSRRAFNQSNLDLYGIVTKQLGLGIARTLNKWLVSPTQITTNDVDGVEGVFLKGAPDIVFAGDYPTNKEVVALETAVLDKDVDGEGFGLYICSPSMAGALKSTPIEAGNPKMILEGNEMNGYQVIRTNLVPRGFIGFGFFSYAVLSEFGSLQVIIDPYTSAKKNMVEFVVNGDFDITTLRPEAFAVGVTEDAELEIYGEEEGE
jgi:HK97 family phage major capsid protein